VAGTLPGVGRLFAFGTVSDSSTLVRYAVVSKVYDQTVIREIATNRSIAFFEEHLQNIVSPDGYTWAGSYGEHLYLISLEGS
jgi:hypothetical protein